MANSQFFDEHVNTFKIRRFKNTSKFCPFASESYIQPLIDFYEQKKLPRIYITIDALPLSLNHQKGQNGKRHFLKPQVHVFREMVYWAYLAQKLNIPINSLAFAFCAFESAHWLTLKNTVQRKDCDNLIKPLFDAFEKASGFKDENFWGHAGLKIDGPKDKTHLLIYFIGDMITNFT